LNKKRCVNCKKYFNADVGFLTNIGFFHSDDCRIEYGIKKTKKLLEKAQQAERKKRAKIKRDFYANDLKTRKKSAVQACHAYIRERDRNNGCITCGRSLVGVKFDAGHYIPAGNHSYTQFMEKNIHGQCVYCNQYNSGKPKEYRQALIDKYGERTVKAIERASKRKIKRTADDYLAIEKHYKDKLKSLMEKS
jgi:hypothetical protein